MNFSVIIPCWNQAQYLSTAIQSVISQTYQPFEIIVVNDGSPDNTQEVASKFNVKIVHQENKGLASARNAGIMNVSPMVDYVFFLDADDVMMPECLGEINKIMETKDADVVAPSIRCFNDKTQETLDTILLANPTFVDFKEGNRLAYCCAYKVDALLEVGGYSPKMDVLGGWEDLWMHYAMMKRGKRIVTVQKPLVMYRIKEKSMWKDAEKNKEALWTQIVKDFPETKDHVKS